MKNCENRSGSGQITGEGAPFRFAARPTVGVFGASVYMTGPVLTSVSRVSAEIAPVRAAGTALLASFRNVSPCDPRGTRPAWTLS